MQIFHSALLKTIGCSLLTICFCTLNASDLQSMPAHTQKRTIVIDPGHGGFDTGAKGGDKTLEKEIALIFAKKIKVKLENKYNVVLTRNDDYWVTTRQRAAIANNTKGELFISIHTNASFIRETRGLSLIYHQPEISDEAAAIDGTPKFWYQTQEKFIPLSRLFTNGLYKRLSKNPNLPSPRVSDLPISSLSGVNMPAILIEVGYLTNPSEEKNLNNPDYVSDYTKEICAEVDFFLENRPINN